MPPATAISEQSAAELRQRCAEVLSANWREGRRRSDGTPFAYTCPARGHYPWQWYWDSCFTAITWRHLDPERSRQELESLLNAQREDGFIGHTIFWNTPLTGFRRFTYNVVGRHATMTSSIQPPLLAWAWSLAVGDPREEPRIARHHDWLEGNRDLEGDGLIWIVQQDESGLDASPQFDAVWGWRAHGTPGLVPLVWRNRHLGYNARAIAAAGHPVLCEVTTNVLYNLSRLALGRPSLTQALIDRCWDERRGLFLSTPGAPATCAALAPLALPDLPEEIGRRMVEEHVLGAFNLPAGLPSVAADEPSFTTHETLPLHRYWRGPVWINAAWLVWLGLVRRG
ncbi:MAG: hypothetical protein J2O48_13095, partial [Solirubrobacterales bacterium]|nr:hypothetical protein [Solirubrobacterales bacterium]